VAKEKISKLAFFSKKKGSYRLLNKIRASSLNIRDNLQK
jgi:hypothetical protein